MPENGKDSTRIIAFCTNKTTYHENRCFQKESCTYPGTGWMPILATLLKEAGYMFYSGDYALSMLEDKSIAAGNIWVIQEENARHGKALIALGAKPFILYSWESPLYTSFFYDRLPNLAPQFAHRALFEFAFGLFKANRGKDHLMQFPSFSVEEERDIKRWDNRREMVMIAANKSALRKWSQNRNLKELAYHMYKTISPVFSKAKKHELHSERIRCLLHFQSKIDLYGALWDDLSNLDSKLQSQLQPVIEKLSPRFCEDKIETLSNYRFCICSENVNYPGYITEKIFDCFVAGTIPVYIGTEAIFRYIPKDIFIYYYDFDSLSDLEKHLMEMTPENAMSKIEKGRVFLRSDEGVKFSNEGFAKLIIDCITEEEN